MEGEKAMMDGEMKGDMEDDDGKKKDGFWGEIGFLWTALFYTGAAAAQLFRYRSNDKYYSAGDILSSNYWKWADMILNWTTLSVMGLSALTQLLAIFGIAKGINVLVWLWVSPFAWTFALAAYNILMFLAYDGAHKKCEDTKDANQVFACVLREQVKLDELYTTVESTAFMYSLLRGAKAWGQANKEFIKEDSHYGKMVHGDSEESDEMEGEMSEEEESSKVDEAAADAMSNLVWVLDL